MPAIKKISKEAIIDAAVDVLLPEIIAAMGNEYGYTEEVARKLHQDMTYYSYGMAILANDCD